MTQEELTRLREMHLELIRSENNLISSRSNSFFTFEGFLFVAVGFLISSSMFLPIIILALIGAIACLPFYKSVRFSYRGCAEVRKHFNKLNEEDKLPRLVAYEVEPFQFGLLPEVFLPWVLFVSWMVIVITYSWKYLHL